tara:strand:+ start:701 stop:892 length:192 start_codon:yes stop_codon:yes gene_type:complete
METSNTADSLAVTSLLGAVAANVPLVTEWLQLLAALVGIVAGAAAIRLHVLHARQLDNEKRKK